VLLSEADFSKEDLRSSPSEEEEGLTTSEAAALLDGSRPHLLALLEEGTIPFRKVGTHRRGQHEDVLEYARRQRKEAEAAMQNLADQAQELEFGRRKSPPGRRSQAGQKIISVSPTAAHQNCLPEPHPLSATEL
jgi:excisionase family DNA binding protein